MFIFQNLCYQITIFRNSYKINILPTRQNSPALRSVPINKNIFCLCWRSAPVLLLPLLVAAVVFQSQSRCWYAARHGSVAYQQPKWKMSRVVGRLNTNPCLIPTTAQGFLSARGLAPMNLKT